MEPRLDYLAAAPEGINALRALYKYFLKEGFDPKLKALVELRVSQINGCAFCLDLHCTELRALGESQQRLDCLSAWRETSFFTEREQAALAWAEAVTWITETQEEDDLYAQAREYFSEKELTDLTLIIGAMNVWNRLAISFHRPIKPRELESENPTGWARLEPHSLS